MPGVPLMVMESLVAQPEKQRASSRTNAAAAGRENEGIDRRFGAGFMRTQKMMIMVCRLPTDHQPAAPQTDCCVSFSVRQGAGSGQRDRGSRATTAARSPEAARA